MLLACECKNVSLQVSNLIVGRYLQPFEVVHNIWTYNMERIYNIGTYNIDTYNHKRSL